ncbi:Cys-Gln thioester bond-forming surface protein [Streptomyces sp. PSKA54]|uniref:Cys-Gln thioester bond-forming surface protein n=1 Tax=Streptomyces himalayensis subsp. aureolus TaxID=2758039 RepID=A0A7W2D8D9_9ACTN|nr:thioester domain-containing protein [Streptomyces himalayensis]MBA4866643.1 Cys-Gln thioester bond-forming surface protein [Streptomyces himalayensis subsp. aureolus]
MGKHHTCVLRLRRTLAKTATRTMIVGVVAALMALANPTAAFAVFRPTPVYTDPAGLLTEATITNIGVGATVNGSTAPAGFNPLDGYPATIPDGSTVHAAAFAGTIVIEDTITGRTGLTYCIDLNTDTEIGVNYELGEWSEANVTNLGYVEYILQHYYPTTGEPSGTTDAIRAAAVQAAIWFFTDNYVLATTGTSATVRGFTAAIVADALANGPSAEPAEPELTVTPEEMPAPATGEIVGPFTVTADGPSTIQITGIEVFTDAAGENQLQDGDTVQPGARLWARSVSDDDPQGFVLERVANVLEGNVLLYDGTNPALEDAQTLVLAQETELVVRAGAVLQPFPAGAVQFDLRIDGEAAGLQGEKVIQVDCEDPDSDLDQQRTVTFAAGTPAGDHSRSLTGIPAGSACTLTESSDGDNGLVDPTTVIDPSTVTIASEETQQVSITNTYERAVGSLQVDVTIDGPRAGRQGTVVLDLDCDDPDGAFDRQFVVDARAEAGTYDQPLVTGIPTGTRCSVTERDTGENKKAALAGGVRIEPPTVTIAEGLTSVINVTHTYVRRGSLAETGAPALMTPVATTSLALVLAGFTLTATTTGVRRRRRRAG